MGQSGALRDTKSSDVDGPVPHKLKRLDLTGRERRLRGAMQAMGRIAGSFARAARRTMPFLVKRRSRILPGAVAFIDPDPDALVSDGPIYEVQFEESDGQARASLIVSTDALAILLEGALGGAGDASSAALGNELTVAQAALVSRIVQKLSEEVVRSIKQEVGVALRVALARSVPVGEECEAAFGDGLGVECTFEGLPPTAKLSLSMGAESLEAAIKEQAADDPDLGDPRFAEALHDVSVELTAELGRVTLGLRRLLTLQPGQILRLSTAVDDPAVLRIAGVTKFEGSPVVSRGQLGIQIKKRHED